MPKKIEQVFDQPKISEMVKAIGINSVKDQIEFELVNLAALMSVGGNLNRIQIPFITEQLIELYPNESIADFKLCFQRGAIGAYGDIQRLDGVTIGLWVKSYLNEKYEVLESLLMKEKKNLYKLPEQPIQTTPDADKLLSDYLEQLKPTNKIPTIDEETIRKYGKEKPERHSLTAGYTYFEVRGIKICATSQQHAEELVEGMIKRGELYET